MPASFDAIDRLFPSFQGLWEQELLGWNKFVLSVEELSRIVNENSGRAVDVRTMTCEEG